MRLSWHTGAYPRRIRRGRRLAAARGGRRLALLGRRDLEPELGERLLDLRGQARHVEADQAAQVGHGPVVDEPVAGDADRAGPASDAVRRGRRAAPPRPPRGPRTRTRRSRRSPRRSRASDLPRAWSRISWRSSGLTNRALMTPTDQPRPSSTSATSRARAGDRPEGHEQQVAAFPEDLAAARPGSPRARARDAEPGVARVVERERVVLGERRAQQRAQLLLVARAGDDEVRQHPLRRHGEHALVARPVLADEAGAVDRRAAPGRRSGTRRARSGRTRAAGTSSRARRPGACPRARGPSRASRRAARRCRRR